MEIRDFWKATLRQDAASMRRFFAPGARVRWHNTNEAFSAEEFIEVNCEYPGAWDGDVERVERVGELIVTAVRVFAAGGRAVLSRRLLLPRAGRQNRLPRRVLGRRRRAAAVATGQKNRQSHKMIPVPP